MVDSWNTESLMIPSLTRNVYPLTAGVGSYTLGPGGTLGGERPQRVRARHSSPAIAGAGARMESVSNLKLMTGWLDCCSGCGIYIDGAYPDANININPPPTEGQSLALQSWGTLSGFADLDTPYGFAPGYALALRWNLAVQLAPYALIMMKIPSNLLQQIEAQAIQAKAAVKSFNSRVPTMDTGFGGGQYDICQDRYI